MRLNYQLLQHDTQDKTPIVFIHGLFGSLSNLAMLARHYEKQHLIVQIDVRNHGLSAHSDEHNYMQMAHDVLETLSDLNIEKFIVVGHSMGAKVAMQMTALTTEKVEKLVVLDMTPVAYTQRHHDEIFQALFAVEEAHVSSRVDAAKIMRDYISEEMVIQFLLKSWNKGQWLFNVKTLFNHYADILDWDVIPTIHTPTLFLRGENSSYISTSAHFSAIDQQFSNAQIDVIQGAGHWLHGEKTTDVLEKMDEFLA